MSIAESAKIEHTFLPSLNESYTDGAIISIIIDCYFGLNYIKKSIESVHCQEYRNVELLIINNGANNEISKYLEDIYVESKNTALIIFKENQFSWDDTEITNAICWNAGLIHCKGEIVSHLSYDDAYSPNYAGKMVKLFNENPGCMTAQPLIISVNALGDVNNDSNLLLCNNRPRYIEGRKVALDFIKGSPERMFCAPGGCLAIRKNLLLKYNGFEQGFDIFQLLKYGIFGDIGFDSEAILYWRHHDNQTNRLLSDKGYIELRNFKRDIKQSDIINIWSKNFSLGELRLLKVYFKTELTKLPFKRVQYMVSHKNLFGLFLVFFHTARECPELLFKTILHSILLPCRIVVNIFRR